jgi:cytoplasmic iron level regulating protein YaaA (DUF328/UPF0246 family)
MLHVISPAKTLDFESPSPTTIYTQPQFLDHSRELIDDLRELPPAQVSSLMSISEKLGQLNAQRFLEWQTPFTPANAKQAMLAFKGDVYTGMAAETYSASDFEFAQQHLRILSGLYGLLRPLDLIQPYRLEMGTGFANKRGKNLYHFWGDIITDRLNAELDNTGLGTQRERVLVNLASTEYWGAVNTKKLHAEVITPVFKDQKNGQYKIISFYAKKARGMMSAYIVQNQLTDAEQLKGFDTAGYTYSKAMSSPKEWVFTRPEQV